MNRLTKLCAALICTGVVLKILSCSATGAESHSWYIKRNGKEIPFFPSDACELDKLGCYYVDKEANRSGKKRLYLTFDAGYENGNIEKILDTLKEENVPAAFFILKNLIYKNSDIVERMANEGHLVCNHTASHKNITACSKEEIEKEIYGLEQIYTKTTGKIMNKYFRFPEGRYSTQSIKIINELGYKTVFWSFAYEDWDNSEQPSEDYAIKKIMDNTHDGAVILLHPTSSTNAKILSKLIKIWREQGYEFATLDDLTK